MKNPNYHRERSMSEITRGSVSTKCNFERAKDNNRATENCASELQRSIGEDREQTE